MSGLGVELRADHLSGRYDRPPALLRRQVASSAEHSDIILLTEVTDFARAGVLPRVGWTVGRGRRGDLSEVAILTLDAVWRTVLRGEPIVLGPDLGPGGRIVARLQLLEHAVTGETLLVGVAHLPASVERGWAARTRRAIAHRRAVLAWRLEVRDWRIAYAPDAELITADWNLNVRRAWVRAWIKTAWPAMQLPRRIPAQGTHAGGRLIDWPLGRHIESLRFTVLPDHPASDHNGIRIRGRIKRR